ncbi:MAG: DNA-binding protein [Sulfuricaulis sp.]
MPETAYPEAPTLSIDTRTLVKQTADRLLAEGIRPTVASVRQRTGRGSAGTINAALKEWWQELAQRLAAIANRPELPAPLLEAADRLWEAALLQAHEALAQYRHEADAKVEDANAAVETATQVQQLAEVLKAAAKQQVTELERIRLDLEKQLSAESARREQAESRFQEIQTEAAQRVQEAHQRTAQLEKLLILEQERYANTERRLVAAADEQKMAREEAEQTLQEHAASWRAQETQLHQQLQSLREQQAKLQGRATALEEQLVALNHQFQALQQEKEAAQTAAATLREQLTSSLQAQEALRAEIARHQTLLEQSSQENVTLQEKRRDMESKIATLQGECQSLHALLGRFSGENRK